MKVYLFGLALGFYSIMATVIYFPYRIESPKGLANEFAELIKYILYGALAIILPLFSIDKIVTLTNLQIPKEEYGKIFSIWLLMWAGHIMYMVFRSWQNGELKVMGVGGKIIYEGRKNKKNS